MEEKNIQLHFQSCVWEKDSILSVLRLSGIPLPLIGMAAYGVVAMLGLQLGGKKLPFEIGGTTGRSILLVTTTSMAVASAYFLYILSTQFTGESCLYCVASALLSLSLFFISVKVIPCLRISVFCTFINCNKLRA